MDFADWAADKDMVQEVMGLQVVDGVSSTGLAVTASADGSSWTVWPARWLDPGSAQHAAITRTWSRPAS